MSIALFVSIFISMLVTCLSSITIIKFYRAKKLRETKLRCQNIKRELVEKYPSLMSANEYKLEWPSGYYNVCYYIHVPTKSKGMVTTNHNTGSMYVSDLPPVDLEENLSPEELIVYKQFILDMVLESKKDVLAKRAELFKQKFSGV